MNPWIGCTKVSAGCDNCYAEAMASRFKWHSWSANEARKRTSPRTWQAPKRWNDRAANTGRRERVFCASLADVFDPKAPPGARDDLWQLIADTPSLDWLLLTKRPANAARMLPDGFSASTWPNVWVGATCEDQPNYDRRWPHIAAIDAAVRFVSYEPMVGPLRLHSAELLDWIIWGGESGRGARMCDPQWARTVTADACRHGIAVFGKQWGTYASNPAVVEAGGTVAAAQLADPPSNGKGGALLDGVLWRQLPEPLIPVVAATTGPSAA